MRHFTEGTRVIVTDKASARHHDGFDRRLLIGYTGTIRDRRRSRAGGISRMVFTIDFDNDLPEELKPYAGRWQEEWALSSDIEGVEKELAEKGFHKWSGCKYKEGDRVLILDGRGYTGPKVVGFTENLVKYIGTIGVVKYRYVSPVCGAYYYVTTHDGWHSSFMEYCLAESDFDDGINSFFEEWG